MTPQRMCVICRRRLPQPELRRWAVGPAGLREGRGPGRGAYVCRSERCERIAFGRGALGRALGVRGEAGTRNPAPECGE